MKNISLYIIEKLHLNKEAMKNNVPNVPTVTDGKFTMKLGDFIKFYYQLPIDCDFVNDQDLDPMTLNKKHPYFIKQLFSDNNTSWADLEKYFEKNKDVNIEIQQDMSASGVTYYKISNLPERPDCKYSTARITDLLYSQSEDIQNELIKYFTKK